MEYGIRITYYIRQLKQTNGEDGLRCSPRGFLEVRQKFSVVLTHAIEYTLYMVYHLRVIRSIDKKLFRYTRGEGYTMHSKHGYKHIPKTFTTRFRLFPPVSLDSFEDVYNLFHVRYAPLHLLATRLDVVRGRGVRKFWTENGVVSRRVGFVEGQQELLRWRLELVNVDVLAIFHHELRNKVAETAKRRGTSRGRIDRPQLTPNTVSVVFSGDDGIPVFVQILQLVIGIGPTS
jgi:hypothetical protein